MKCNYVYFDPHFKQNLKATSKALNASSLPHLNLLTPNLSTHNVSNRKAGSGSCISSNSAAEGKVIVAPTSRDITLAVRTE